MGAELFRVWISRFLPLAAITLLAGCSLQTALIYPGRKLQGQDFSIVHPRGDEQIVSLTTADGTKISAMFGKALDADGSRCADAATRPTIIFFYGNGSCMVFAHRQFQQFRRLGANVIVADYEGYGMSEGEPSEKGCYATADAEYDYLACRGDIDMARIVPAGSSLGGAVAIDLAWRRPAAGLMTFSTFTSMDDMGNFLAPWIPQWIFLSQHFNSIKKIAGINCPILIAHGTADTFIPPEMSDRLAAAAKGPVTRLRVVGANHNDVFYVGGEDLADSIREFLGKLP